MTASNELPDLEVSEDVPVAVTSGMSGDPLLKRLVDLAHLGWGARLVLYSNGQVITGTLVSPAQFRAALATSIRQRKHGPFVGVDELVASVIDAEDPPVPESATGTPEPRFIHLADVRLGASGQAVAPFLRLRLPAVSGFWITAEGDPDAKG